MLHSTFNNITNLINEEKNIISVAHDKKYLSPNTVILSEINHKSIISITINKEEIYINETCFNKKDLTKYDSSIKFHISEPKSLIKRIEKVIKENISEFNPLSLAFLIEEKFETGFTSRFQKAFVKHIKTAWNHIKTKDIIQGVKKMKGSGIGLTPSGDDFITGMLYAILLIGEINKTNTTKIRKSIYKAAISKNEISKNMIYHASEGTYFKQFKDLQIAFNKNDEKTILYLRSLIEIGETSGSDMLTGFYLSIKYLNKKI